MVGLWWNGGATSVGLVKGPLGLLLTALSTWLFVPQLPSPQPFENSAKKRWYVSPTRTGSPPQLVLPLALWR